MTDEEIAWVAGVLEGEGCFRNQKNYSALVSVAMCDKDVLDRLKELTGLGNVTGPYLPKDAPDNWKPSWQWNVGVRQEVRVLLETIYPWMGERRRQKIDDLRPLFSRPSRQDWRRGTSLVRQP